MRLARRVDRWRGNGPVRRMVMVAKFKPAGARAKARQESESCAGEYISPIEKVALLGAMRLFSLNVHDNVNVDVQTEKRVGRGCGANPMRME